MAKKLKNIKKQTAQKPASSLAAFSNLPEWSFKLIFLALFVLGVLVFRDYLVFKNLYLFTDDVSSDALNTYYPFLVQEADYLRETGFPSWSFQIGMGQSNYPGGIFDPFNWILNLLGSDKLAYGIAYVECLKVLLAGLLFYGYVRVLGLGKYAAFLGGILMAFSGYMVLGTGWYLHSKNIVFFIVMLLGFELFFKERKWWLLPLPFIFTSAQNLYFNLIFLAIYAPVRFLAERGFQWKEGFRFSISLSGLFGLGILLAASPLSGYFFQIFFSPRLSGGTGYDNLLSTFPAFGLEITEHYVTAILRLFSNDLLGTASEFKGWYNYLEAPAFYCGLLTLLLVPQVFFFLHKKQKWLYGGLLGLWVFMVVFPYFRYALYAFKGTYYKHAISLFVPVTMLILAAHSIYFIFQNNRRVHIPTLLATLVILLSMLFWPLATELGVAINTALQILIAVLLVVYTVLLMGWNVGKYQQWVKISLPVLVCIEVFFMANITVNDRDALPVKEFRERTGYNDYTLEAIDFLKKNDTGFYRLTKDYASSPATGIYSLNDALVQGFYGTPSYSSFNQNSYIEFLQTVGEVSRTDEMETRFARGLNRRPLLQGWASCKYLLHKTSGNKDFSTFYFSLLTTVNDIEIYQNNVYLPLGFTYDQYQTSNDFNDRLAQNPGYQHLSLFAAVAVSPEVQPALKGLTEWAGMGNPDSLTLEVIHQTIASRRIAPALAVTHHSQNKITGNIRVEKPRLLFLSIPYDEGWSATVNGEPAGLLLVNAGFMGIMLPEGEHTIELAYLPQLFYEGWLVCFIGLCLYIFLLVRSKKKRGELSQVPPA